MPTSTEHTLSFLGQRAQILVRGEDTDGRVDMVELTCTPGDQPPLHVHHDQEESWYVLAGEMTVYLPGEERVLRAGDFLMAPRGVPHTYRAVDEGVRTIVQSTPAGFAAFVEVVSDTITEPGAELDAAATGHGITLLGPPGTRP